MTAHDDDERERRLQQAILEMRREVPVNPAWRDALDRELAELEPPAPRRVGGWHLSVPAAIAAALAFMLVGAIAGDVARRSIVRSSEPIAMTGDRGDDRHETPHAIAASASIGVRFSVMAPGVRHVTLVGDFNGWDADATPLTLAADGRTWTTLLPLPAGRHAYAFVIDGQVVRDPAAPAEAEEDFGVPNSLVLVSNHQ